MEGQVSSAFLIVLKTVQEDVCLIFDLKIFNIFITYKLVLS